MKEEIIIKELPRYNVYYKEGIIADYNKLPEFILSSADECLKTNPDIKCLEPDYCFVSYLDKEYKQNDIRVRYYQAVENIGKENETIKFEILEPTKAVCLYHRGSFENINESYNLISSYIKDNNLEVVGNFRERYIDGMWNKEKKEDWLTEIQIPIK